MITHGFSGSGKTTLAQQYAREHGAIHIRSDVIRKQLAKLPTNAQLNSPYETGLYSSEFTEKNICLYASTG